VDCWLLIWNNWWVSQIHQSAIFNVRTHGVVAKWEGKGLQNPDHGFKSRRRLSKLLKRAAFCFNDIAAYRWEAGIGSGKIGGG
jgi:hypothetical protein